MFYVGTSVQNEAVFYIVKYRFSSMIDLRQHGCSFLTLDQDSASRKIGFSAVLETYTIYSLLISMDRTNIERNRKEFSKQTLRLLNLRRQCSLFTIDLHKEE